MVQPDPIASAADTVTFVLVEETAGGAILFGAAPVDKRVEIRPVVGDLADTEELFEEGEGLLGGRAMDLGNLRGKISYDGDEGVKRSELAFGGVEEDGKTLLWIQCYRGLGCWWGRMTHSWTGYKIVETMRS